MDLLKKCAVRYSEYIGNDFCFLLDCGLTFTASFQKRQFFHFIGLHKLTDLSDLNTKSEIVLRNILSNVITLEDIKKSVHYPKIKDRLENFLDIDSFVNSKIIIDFDYTKVKGGNTRLMAKYILFKEHNGNNLHYCFAIDRLGNYYPETFIVQADDYYIKNQVTYEVVNIECKKYKLNK